jgi:hypothetical protein
MLGGHGTVRRLNTTLVGKSSAALASRGDIIILSGRLSSNEYLVTYNIHFSVMVVISSSGNLTTKYPKTKRYLRHPSDRANEGGLCNEEVRSNTDRDGRALDS